MNERIRELAEQAGLFVDLNGNPWPRALSAEESIAAYSKFSELIVKECAGLAKTKSDFIGERAMKFAEDTNEETTAKATAWQFLVFEQEIKKYFGVE